MRNLRAPRDIEPAGTPEDGLRAFVALAHASGKYGRNLDFQARRWEVTGQTRDRPGVTAGRQSVTFGEELDEPLDGAEPAAADGHGGAESSRADGRAPSIGSYVRSYVRLMDEPSHTQIKYASAAGRFLAAAMASRGITEVAGITSEVLDEAGRLISARYTSDAASHYGYALEAHARFLSGNGMTRASLGRWRFGRVRRPQKTRKGAEAASRSKKLLPSKELLTLILMAYRSARHPADLIVTRIMALLLAAPERINEVLALEVHPEVELHSPSGRPALGLRWKGSKLYPDGIKVIPTCMSATVRRSLEVLRAETAEGRRIMAWYQANPGKLYLPPELEHVRDSERLPATDVAALLGAGRISWAHITVTSLRIPLLAPVGRLTGAAHNVSFKALEEYFIAMLPQRMRDAGGWDASPLLVARLGTFRRKLGGPCACMFEKVTHRRVACSLTSEGSNVTIFRRLGLDPSGRIGVRTTAFRHFLNTLAMRGGLSDTDLAMWSGRKDTRGNAAYDQRTSEEMMEGARRANPLSRRTTSPLAQGADRDANPEDQP